MNNEIINERRMPIRMASVYVTTNKRETRRPNSRTCSVSWDAKEGKKCSAPVKFLILTIALLIVFCLVLLNLYLREHARNLTAKAVEKPETRTTRIRAEHEKYHGGLCWTTDCLHAALGKKFGFFQTLTNDSNKFGKQKSAGSK